MTQAVQSRLSSVGNNIDAYSSITTAPPYSSQPRVAVAVARAIESIELLKTALQFATVARYGVAVDAARNELSVAEAVFSSELANHETTREQTAIARTRLQKAKADVDQASELMRTVVIDANAMLTAAIAQATAVVNRAADAVNQRDAILTKALGAPGADSSLGDDVSKAVEAAEFEAAAALAVVVRETRKQ